MHTLENYFQFVSCGQFFNYSNIKIITIKLGTITVDLINIKHKLY